MKTTKMFLLCIDDYEDGLKNVRLIDSDTFTPAGESGVGDWLGYTPAIIAAVTDAVGKGNL